MAARHLKDLTERELLNEKVERLETEMLARQTMDSRVEQLERQVIELRVKYQMWIAAIGRLASIGGGLIQKLINF